MAWYKRSKLGLDMIRNLESSRSKQPFSRGKVLTSCPEDVSFMKRKSSSSKSSSSSSRGPIYYYAFVALGIVATGGYLTNLETIPYSKRTHLVLVPRPLEKALAKKALKDVKRGCYGKVLPPTHPTSVRFGLIAKNIIDALEKDLRGENDNIDVWGYTKYFGNIKSRATRHLEHFDWEVVLVDGDPGPNGGVMIPCAGKIVVFTGLLKNLSFLDDEVRPSSRAYYPRSEQVDRICNAEVAKVIANEVARHVARHAAEKMTKLIRVISLGVLFDMIFGESPIHEEIISLYFDKPLQRKMNLEVDYIASLLMDSAGYHSHIAT